MLLLGKGPLSTVAGERSDDEGATWTPFGVGSLTPTGARIDDVARSSAGVTLVGSFRSTDGGVTFGPAPTPVGSVTACGATFVALAASRIARSDDGGLTWTDWGEGLPGAGFSTRSLSCSAGGPGGGPTYVYATVPDGGLGQGASTIRVAAPTRAPFATTCPTARAPPPSPTADGTPEPTWRRSPTGRACTPTRPAPCTRARFGRARAGEGTLHWPNGASWTGTFTDGMGTGDGQYADASGARLYRAPFSFDWTPGTPDACLAGDCVDGDGQYRYPSGSVYEGAFRHGLRHGAARYTLPSGAAWTGTFADDTFAPGMPATIALPNGAQYRGAVNVQGDPDGEGTYTYPDGRTWTGPWVTGNGQADGDYATPDGRVYTRAPFAQTNPPTP